MTLYYVWFIKRSDVLIFDVNLHLIPRIQRPVAF